MSKRVRFQIHGWSYDNIKHHTMEPETSLTYFTCTLGEAARWNQEHPHRFETVNHLIDEQAKDLRQRPAVNFPGGCFGEEGREMKSDFTYRELRDYSVATAVRLRRRMQIASRGGSCTVGLICASTPEFVLTWLGLMRLGKSVMLLAPQLESTAIKHLCSTCKISVVFADARNYDMARNLKDGILAINLSNILYNLKSDPPATALDVITQASDLAYLFHTSGTSSGLPKPIPQTHFAAVGVLPRLPGGENHATFSTTPLYHGGIADCLRAWSSGATIHLFPGTQPITTGNILRAVDRANAFLRGVCPVSYFTSVPYILQMLVADSTDGQPTGLALLQAMDLVGVGGAALPTSLGDELVSKQVRLVSRFGSAECGFLLSSHRDYAKDHDWSWLRADPDLQPDYYDFEPQAQRGDDSSSQLFEFVVKPRWPHRGKTNRPDGSFATADLFEQHATIANAWQYHSRADAQITLLSGKKFDPAPVEGELLASAVGKRILAETMIFGTGRDAPGILLIPKWTSDYVTDEQIIDEVWPTVSKMNSETQSHARLGKGNIVVVRGQSSDAAVLPKSSKGTILRRQAENLFADEIERVYQDIPTTEGGGHMANVPDDRILEELTKLFDDVLGRRVSATDDLFSQGVDSVACSRVRKRISTAFFDADQVLPLNIIYDQGSIDQLSEYIIRRRKSEDVVTPDELYGDQPAEEQLMLDFVEKYRHSIHSPTGCFDHEKDRTVVLTGATGFLGTHLLDLLLQDSNVSKIICLVRSSSAEDASQRIGQALENRGLASSDNFDRHGSRLVCMPCSLSEPRLGLTEANYQIASQATMIIHSAWPVNFSLKLKSFQGQFTGIQNLLELRDSTRGSAARFVFISSIAAVSASGVGDRPIRESLSSEPEDASPLGYSRSKWVAENICTSAKVGGSFSVPASTAEGATLADEERSPIIIIRVGQLCGNERGVWNTTEAYPIMLSSARITGCLPELDESLSWLPVDVAAKAVLELSCADLRKQARGPRLSKIPIYHVTNRHQEPSWTDMMEWIADSPSAAGVDDPEPGHKVGMVPPQVWLQSLEGALETKDHPARSLLHLWKQAYSGENDTQAPVFDTRRAEAVSESINAVQPLSKEDVMRMWTWIQASL